MFAFQTTVSEIETKTFTEINGDNPPQNEDDHTNGLIADLAWILLLGAIVTLLFKKLKQILWCWVISWQVSYKS